MKKIIWVICSDKQTLAEAQRKINEGGGLKAYCLMSYEAVEKAVGRLANYGKEQDQPSLIIADYETGLKEDFSGLYFLKIQPAFAGIPLFFMCNENSQEVENRCYELGASVVLNKPFGPSDVQRIERVSWQHEMTRNYEKVIQIQAGELEASKEIKRLNGLLESRNELLAQVFGKYFSEDIVENILNNPSGAVLGGSRETVTVMMADLRGFTSMSDTLPGDVVVDILDNFLDVMLDIIKKHHGTVIEIIGDEILSIFGAPVKSKNTVVDAISAAIEMQNAMRKVNSYNMSKEYPLLEMGIGIHKGEVFVGNIGSEHMMRYNVIGKAVNLCSRIESYTFGGQILCSCETVADVKNSCVPGDTFWISMKGFRKQIPICEVTEITTEGERYALIREAAKPMHYINHEPVIMVYLMMDKFIGEYSIRARALEISDAKLLIEVFESENERLTSLTLHYEVELLIAGKNAYAKVVKVNGNKLMLRFTYQSEGFYEACVENQE